MTNLSSEAAVTPILGSAEASHSWAPKEEKAPRWRSIVAGVGVGVVAMGGIGTLIYVGLIRPHQALVARERSDASALDNERIGHIVKNSWRMLDGYLVVDMNSNPNHPNHGCRDTFEVIDHDGRGPVTLEVPAEDPLSHTAIAIPNSVSGDIEIKGPDSANAVIHGLQQDWAHAKHHPANC